MRLARLGIDAPVSAVGIDLKAGALGIPKDIKRVGWWRDGAAPGDDDGHRAARRATWTPRRRARARSSRSRAPAAATSSPAGRKTLRYRVTKVAIMRKAALPTSIYTRTGSPSSCS